MSDKKVIPTRVEADKAIDQMLAESPWVHLAGIDRSAVGLLKDANYEYVSLRGFVLAHPEKKTPGVAERLDQLRKELTDRLESFGLTPEGRRGLGLSHGAASLGAQNRARDQVVLAYRRPADQEALIRQLVDLGIWHAVEQQFKPSTNGGK